MSVFGTIKAKVVTQVGVHSAVAPFGVSTVLDWSLA